MSITLDSPHSPIAHQPETDDDLARSLWSLARSYARRRHVDPEAISSLRDSGEAVDDLIVRGMLAAASEQPDPHEAVLRALPELWWLDAHLGIASGPALAERMNTRALDAIRDDALRLVVALDKGERPAAWVTGPDLFTNLLADSEIEDGAWNRARVLARGVSMVLTMAPGWLTAALGLVRSQASSDLLRALARDVKLTADHRWVAALLLRGGQREVALGAASLMFADVPLRHQVRDMVAMLPKTSVVRIAQCHGLLSLGGESGMEVAEIVRTGFLAQAWQNNDLAGLPWSDAFRGELMVSRSLLELGHIATPLARDVCDGLVAIMSDEADGPHSDSVRREAVAECLAWILRANPEYCAALRQTESHLRDIARRRGTGPLGPIVRAYAQVLLSTARLLVERDCRSAARGVYARVLRLRKAYPELLPVDAYPDTIDKALHADDADRSARHWVALEIGSADPIDPTAVRPSPEDPLPAAHEIVAAADGLAPLPNPTAEWVDAVESTPLAIIGALVPLPIRHLFNLSRRMLGMTPKARFVLSDDGRGAVTVTRRILGVGVHTTRRGIAGGRLFPFPEGNLRADRMLGRWAALLLVLGTVGTWLALKANTDVALLGGSSIAAFGLFGYLGALRLHRAVASGFAVAVRDDHDHVSVWTVSPATRLLIERHTDKSQHQTIADITAPGPDGSAAPARAAAV
ncbi:MAG: hypothetical protein ACI9OJ_005178 [Myxococcota bacterium]|jgi:hypothetical protein